MSAGGGSKRLFRKVEDRSSEFYPHEYDVRRDGSYIYEEFVTTQGTDVKVYTVGPNYAHAEARKSPVVDGKVKRDSFGREIRYPVILSPAEKEMARKIVQAFRQTVCGFDILRVQGKSYCCDVNGFSFVKNSKIYYADASHILGEMMFKAVRPDSDYQALINRKQSSKTNSNTLLDNNSPSLKVKLQPNILELKAIPSSENFLDTSKHLDNYNNNDDRPPSPAASIISEAEVTSQSSIYNRKYETEELRCVIAVIRHGDRTPKQKIKIIYDHPYYLDYFHSYNKTAKNTLKVKSRKGLTEFLATTQKIIDEDQVNPEIKSTLIQMRDVLSRWEISGINRKLQMKPQKFEEIPITSPSPSPSIISDGGTSSANNVKATEIEIILKWGGDLTSLGIEQAESLGAQFRNENYPDQENGGILRLHATYRHDLKIKSSDEGRVMKTAAAFTKGLLELEGQLTPILASLVTVEDKNRRMLDCGDNYEIKNEMDRCKEHLNLLQMDTEITDELIDLVAPDCSPFLKDYFLKIGNPVKTLKKIHELIKGLCDQLAEVCIKQKEEEQQELLKKEQLQLEDPVFSPSSYISTEEGEVKATENSDSPGAIPDTIGDVLINTNVSNEDFAIAISPLDNTPKSETDGRKSLNNCDSNGNTTNPSNVNKVGSIHEEDDDDEEESVIRLYTGETFDLMLDRWTKLNKDFYNKKVGRYNLTKVPDVYDMIRYDILHNSRLHLEGMEELYRLSKIFEICVVSQEYGIDSLNKRFIGSKMCGALLEKITYDLKVASFNCPSDIDPSLAASPTFENYPSDTKLPPELHPPSVVTSSETAAISPGIVNSAYDGSNSPLANPQANVTQSSYNLPQPTVTDSFMLYKLDHSHADEIQINSIQRCVRTRLYFTSESHLQTVLNVFKYPKPGSPFAISPEGIDTLNSILDISYLSQIVIRLFESRIEPNKFSCELSVSSGTTDDPINDKLNTVLPTIPIEKYLSLEQLLGCLHDAIDLYNSNDDSENIKYSNIHKFNSNVNNSDASFISEEPAPVDIQHMEEMLEELQELQNSYQLEVSQNEHHTYEYKGLSDIKKKRSSDELAQLTMPMPIPIRRNASYTIQMDSLENTSDNWEKAMVEEQNIQNHLGNHGHGHGHHHGNGHNHGHPHLPPHFRLGNSGNHLYSSRNQYPYSYTNTFHRSGSGTLPPKLNPIPTPFSQLSINPDIQTIRPHSLNSSPAPIPVDSLNLGSISADISDIKADEELTVPPAPYPSFDEYHQ